MARSGDPLRTVRAARHARHQPFQDGADRARLRLRRVRAEHVRRRCRAGQQVGRGRRHALPRGGRLRRPAAVARSGDGRGGALARGHGALDLRLHLGRRHPARGAAAARLPQAAGARPCARLRAADRLRAGVLPADRRSRAAVRGLPHLQRHAEHVRAVHPGAGRAAERLRPRGDHRQLRVRRVAVGAALPADARHGRPRPLLLVQERGQGAGAPCTATRPPS